MPLDTVALTALVISIVALVIAVFQFLAQAVGTIEGYRHCQESVIGRWSEHRRRDWSWRQFRATTLFKTPEITLGPCHNQQKGWLALYGDDSSREATYCRDITDKKNAEEQGTELVCWVPLLDALHDGAEPMAKVLFGDHHDREDQGKALRPSWPCIRLRQRSWDLMPPDVVRPFATTTASDIAILACRMGVRWKVFRPPEGIMEGEGEGHIFFSTRIRGLGTVLSYIRLLGADGEDIPTRTSPPSNGPKFRYVWTPVADRLWFGILPGNPDLGLPDYRIGTTEEIFSTLKEIDPQETAVNNLRNLQGIRADYLHGFCDIVPMVAAWLRQPGTNLNWYPRPLKNTLGLTWYHLAFHQFKFELEKYNTTHNRRNDVEGGAVERNNVADAVGDNEPQSSWVLRMYRKYKNKWPVEWDGISPDVDARTVDFYDDLERLYDHTTTYFLKVRGKLKYMDLVTAHLREAPRSYRDAEVAVQGWAVADSERWDLRRKEAMSFYWKYMPDYRVYMAGRGCMDGKLVDEAWITLVFRAFLWMRAHVPKENDNILPSQYYGSRLPIYIS